MPVIDARTILDTIAATGQARIFIVRVEPGGAFSLMPAAGPPLSAGEAIDPRVQARWRECVRSAAAVTYEEQGEGRWWQTNVTPIAGPDGAIVQLLGTAFDITERKRAEAELRDFVEPSRRLLDAIDGLSEGVAIFDAEDRLALCNARYRDINSAIADILVPGVTYEAVLRKGIERGLHPSAIGGEAEWLHNCMEQHRNAKSHFERQSSNGQWLQILEHRTASGATTILATEITEVKRRELALSMLAVAGQDGGDFFADAVVSLAIGLGYRGAGISFLAENGTEAVPLAFCEGGLLAPGDAHPIAGTPCETVLEERDFWAIDSDVTLHYPQAEKLRARRAVSFVGDIVMNASQEPIGIVFAFNDKPDPEAPKRRDILGLVAARIGLELQRREAETKLREAKEAAEIASRAKSEFLANMSHELRTPLNAIIGFSQIIGDEIMGPAGRAEYRDYARDIHSSSQHLLQIINDILDVSRIEAGMLSLRESEVDLQAVLEACRRVVAPRAADAEIALAMRLPSTLPSLMADERMLKQIVLNILSNAIKFTPKGGRVELAAEAEGEAGVAITIRDTGIGIAGSDFEKIFKPFVQVDSALNRKFEGTGLGLPLSKGLAELHGGSIAVASEVGKGTVVTVHLPLRRA